MGGELRPTMKSLGGGKLEHSIENDKFVCTIEPQTQRARQAVDHLQFMRFDEKTDSKIIEYATRPDTKIVEVYSITRTAEKIRTVTQYYPNHYPVTILTENCRWNEAVFYERSRLHYEFMRNLEQATRFYNDVVDEYQRFIEATGLYLQDMNGNNILTETFDDFKLVDIASIQRYERQMQVDPVGVLLTGKFRWDHYPRFLEHYDSIVFKYIPNHVELVSLIDTNIEPRII